MSDRPVAPALFQLNRSVGSGKCNRGRLSNYMPSAASIFSGRFWDWERDREKASTLLTTWQSSPGIGATTIKTAVRLGMFDSLSAFWCCGAGASSWCVSCLFCRFVHARIIKEWYTPLHHIVQDNFQDRENTHNQRHQHVYNRMKPKCLIILSFVFLLYFSSFL